MGAKRRNAAAVLALWALAGCNNPAQPPELSPSSVIESTATALSPGAADLQPAAAPAPAPLPEPFRQAYECLSTCTTKASAKRESEADNSLPEKLADLLRQDSVARKNFLALTAKLTPDLRPSKAVSLLENTDKPLKNEPGMAVEAAGVQYQVYPYVNYQAAGSDRTPNNNVTRESYLYGGLMVVVEKNSKAMSMVYTEGGLALAEGGAPVSIALAYEVMREVHLVRRTHDEPRLRSDNELRLPMNDEVLPLGQRRMSEFASHFDPVQRLTSKMELFSLEKALPPKDPSEIWWSADFNASECIESKGPASRLDMFTGTPGLRADESNDSSGKLSRVEVVAPMAAGRERVWTYYKSKERCLSEKVNNGKSLANRYR